MMIYKYVVKNVARKHGKTACFMPKPLFGDNGSGMHTHQSLWKKGKPLFAGNEYAGLSEMALYYAGGLLKHARALCAICNPTTNSYKRLVPGYEAPVNLAYSARNRCAAIRIPTYSENPKAKRLEYRPPDPAANPYLAFAALLMAGLDGDPEQDRAGRTAGQEHLRTAAGGTEEGSERGRQPQRGAGLPGEGPRVPAQGRRLHRGLPGHVDQHQAQGARRPAPAPASVRVLPLLRRVKHHPGGGTGEHGADESPRRFVIFGGAVSPDQLLDCATRRAFKAATCRRSKDRERLPHFIPSPFTQATASPGVSLRRASLALAKETARIEDFVAGNFGIGGHRTLAAAAHAAQKRALRRHAMKRVEMIQPLANFGDALVVRANLDANGALADARQHHVRVQNRRQQTVRHRVAVEPCRRV